jgi:hypothetical protein
LAIASFNSSPSIINIDQTITNFMLKITALQDTTLTKDLLDSSQIEDPDRAHKIPTGTVLNGLAIAPQVKNGKRLITFDQSLGTGNFNTWFIYLPHWKAEGKVNTNYLEAQIQPHGTAEADETPAITISLQPAKLVLPIDWRKNDQPVSEYFRVLEVTKGSANRRPANGSPHEKNILKLAAELNKIRKEWGSAIGVTSWYRPLAVNKGVGGASGSQHLTGSGVDIQALNGQHRKFEDFLSRHWGGGLGFGIASGRGFTHLDLRGGGWRRGPGNIRWMY